MFLLALICCITGCYSFHEAADALPANGTVILSRNNDSSISYSSGVIRVYDDGWGNICDDGGYHHLEADIICHQLGYTGASSFSRAGLVNYGIDYLPMKWDDFNCRDNSYLSVAQCFYSTDIDGGCVNTDSYDVTVSCFTTRIWDSNPFPGMVRLQGGAYSNQGRVEVYCNGQWGTICDDGFDSTDANTICKQLGYDSASYYNHLLLPGSSSQPIWSVDMTSSSNDTCFGTSNNCPVSSLTTCNHTNDVSIECGESSYDTRLTVNRTTCAEVTITNCTYYGQIRLSDGSASYEGRVEICIDNIWGTVCDDGFTNTSAEVVCRQLGYDTTGATYAFLGSGTGSIFLDNVQCIGSEDTLLQCPRNRIGEHDCGHSEDVAVICPNVTGTAEPIDNDNGITAGAAIGATVGCIVVIGIIAVACLVCVYRSNKNTAKTRLHFSAPQYSSDVAKLKTAVSPSVDSETTDQLFLPDDNEYHYVPDPVTSED